MSGTLGCLYWLPVLMGTSPRSGVLRGRVFVDFLAGDRLGGSTKLGLSSSLSSSIIWGDDLFNFGLILCSMSSSSSSSSIVTLGRDRDGSTVVDLAVVTRPSSHFRGVCLRVERGELIAAAVPSPSGRAGMRVLPRMTIS